MGFTQSMGLEECSGWIGRAGKGEGDEIGAYSWLVRVEKLISIAGEGVES